MAFDRTRDREADMLTIRAAEITTNRERLRRKIVHDPLLNCFGLQQDRVLTVADTRPPAPASGLTVLLTWPTEPSVYEHVLVDTLEVRVPRPTAAQPPLPQHALLDHVDQLFHAITPRERPVLRIVRGERRREDDPHRATSTLVGRYKVLAQRADPGPRPAVRIVIPATRHQV